MWPVIFDFALWDGITGGNQLGTQTITGVNINEGVFTVQLDFGNVFTGDGVWLETAVQCDGDAGYTTTVTPSTPERRALCYRPAPGHGHRTHFQYGGSYSLNGGVIDAGASGGTTPGEQRVYVPLLIR